MPKGRVNTLMAGTGKAVRGRYTAAGYTAHDEAKESELYLERDQAGFARELIRDNNRIGYSGQGLDDDGLPFSFFIDEVQRDEERRRAKKTNARAAARQREEELTFTERLAIVARRERRAVAVCCALFALNLTLLAFWGQAMIDSVSKRDQILAYENGKAAYEMEIQEARRKIDAAQSGERIRNLAQNELGMLRGERVETQKIYIQTSNLASAQQPAAVAEESAGLLDWLLSVADIFDFKS